MSNTLSDGNFINIMLDVVLADDVLPDDDLQEVGELDLRSNSGKRKVVLLVITNLLIDGSPVQLLQLTLACDTEVITSMRVGDTDVITTMRTVDTDVIARNFFKAK